MKKIIRSILVMIAKITKISNIILFIRNYYYKIIFKTFGINSGVFGKIKVYNSGNINLGSNSFLNEGVVLCASSEIIIGNYCHISAFSKLYTVGLNLSEKDYKKRGHVSEAIIIKDGVWVGLGSIILKGVIIGEGSIIAAGSVITKNIPPFEVWGGVPAKKIKDI